MAWNLKKNLQEQIATPSRQAVNIAVLALIVALTAILGFVLLAGQVRHGA